MAQQAPITQSSTTKPTLILHRPDGQLLFEPGKFLCSSVGDFDQERLEFFVNVIHPYWLKTHCTLHQLAEYLMQFDIELWTAEDVRIDNPTEFAFDVKFLKQYEGTLLIQCELSHKERVH